MRKLALCCFAVILVFSSATRVAQAALSITISQVGSDVVVSGSGSLDVAGLSLSSYTSSEQGSLDPGISSVKICVNSTNVNIYSTTFTGPSSFGSGGNSSPISGTINIFGLAPASDLLFVPYGYTSGASLTGTATYAGTFSSLGITPGTYNYTFNSGTNLDTVTITAVPEPSTWALLAGGSMLLAVAVRRLRSTRAA